MFIDVFTMELICKKLLNDIIQDIDELNKISPEDDEEAVAISRKLKQAEIDKKYIENELLIAENIGCMKYEPSNYDIMRILEKYGYIAFPGY